MPMESIGRVKISKRVPRLRWPAGFFRANGFPAIGGAIAALWPVVTSRAGRIAIVGAGVLSLALIGAAIGVLRLVPLSSENARERFVAALADRLDAEVELQELRVHILPSLRAEGRGLTIRHKGRRDVPPLISIAHFSAESGLVNLLHRHISRVDIDGLDIEIPPDRNHSDTDAPEGRPEQ